MFRSIISKSRFQPLMHQHFRKFTSVSFNNLKSPLLINLSGTAEGVTQTLRVDGSGHTNHIIKTDGYKEFAGKDEHPDPIQYLFASVTGCQHITHKFVARDYGVNVGKANISTEADLTVIDPTPDKYPGFVTTYVKIIYEVESDATDEVFEKIREETEAKCPIAQIFIKSAGLNFDSTWVKKPLPK